MYHHIIIDFASVKKCALNIVRCFVTVSVENGHISIAY